jgi:hypothetical protein
MADREREVLPIAPVAEGWARSRAEAIAVAQAARRNVMEQNRNLDR